MFLYTYTLWQTKIAVEKSSFSIEENITQWLMFHSNLLFLEDTRILFRVSVSNIINHSLHLTYVYSATLRILNTII